MITSSILREMIRKEIPEEILREISEGSSYHRIQGSWEIVKAMEWLKEKIEEKGIEAHILYFDQEHTKKLGVPVPRWKLKYAELELDFGHRKEVVSTEDNILLAAPHTPSGEVEGEVQIIGGHRELDEKCSGKILLVDKEQRLTYYMGKSLGVLGFIFTKKVRHDYVFPYFGLFLNEDLLREAPPAVSIPWSLAKRIFREVSMGGKVRARIYVEAERDGPEGIPVLLAEVGEGKNVIGTAHICHPAPGSHDNMSGCIALYHALLRLKDLQSSGIFREKFTALWIPEYSGTISYIWEKAPTGIGNVNLDMVGTLSEEPLKVYRGFLTNVSALEAAFVKSLGVLSNVEGTKLYEIGYRVLRYANGSDHDLFNYYSFPGFMVAHVIDPMYHTSGDLPNNVDPYLIREVSVATAMSAVLATSELAERLYKEYVCAITGYLKINSESIEILKKEISSVPEVGDREREIELESRIPGLEYPLTSGRLLMEGKTNLASRFYSERELERVAMYGGSLLKRGIPYQEAKEILYFDAAIPENSFKKFFEMITDEGALDRGDKNAFGEGEDPDIWESSRCIFP